MLSRRLLPTPQFGFRPGGAPRIKRVAAVRRKAGHAQLAIGTLRHKASHAGPNDSDHAAATKSGPLETRLPSPLACIAWLRSRLTPAITIRPMPPGPTAWPSHLGPSGYHLPQRRAISEHRDPTLHRDGRFPCIQVPRRTAAGDLRSIPPPFAPPPSHLPTIRPHFGDATGHLFPTRPTRPRAGPSSFPARREHGS